MMKSEHDTSVHISWNSIVLQSSCKVLATTRCLGMWTCIGGSISKIHLNEHKPFLIRCVSTVWINYSSQFLYKSHKYNVHTSIDKFRRYSYMFTYRCHLRIYVCYKARTGRCECVMYACLIRKAVTEWIHSFLFYGDMYPPVVFNGPKNGGKKQKFRNSSIEISIHKRRHHTACHSRKYTQRASFLRL